MLPAWLTRFLGLDVVLIVSTLTIAVIGAVMVYSATRYELISAGLGPTYWVKRDVIFLGVGVLVMIALAFIDYHHWEAMWAVVFGTTGFLLLVVMVPHIGKHTLGSTRWIPLGPFQFQPSAFADLAVIIAVATLLSRAEPPISWSRVAGVVALAGGTMAVVAKQPDLGSAIVIGVVVAAIAVAGGVRARQLGFLGLVAVTGVFAVIHFGLLHGYQTSRLTSFLHQNSQTNSANYNLTQSKIDIGSGGILGKGLFRDQQTNLQYVPEQQTDFIFTAVGGQLGFVGTCAVLVLYGIIATRLWKAARSAKDTVGTLIATGVFTLLTFSVFENAGMTMGIMPITGIPLPFMSYGGSADVVFFAAVGIALNIGNQAKGRTESREGLTGAGGIASRRRIGLARQGISR